MPSRQHRTRATQPPYLSEDLMKLILQWRYLLILPFKFDIFGRRARIHHEPEYVRSINGVIGGMYGIRRFRFLNNHYVEIEDDGDYEEVEAVIEEDDPHPDDNVEWLPPLDWAH